MTVQFDTPQSHANLALNLVPPPTQELNRRYGALDVKMDVLKAEAQNGERDTSRVNKSSCGAPSRRF